MAQVHVRAETPMLGLGWHAEVTVERTPLVDAAIDDGRLTVIGAEPDGPLRGEALDAALRAHGLQLTGTARVKRGRLTRHINEVHDGDWSDTTDVGEGRRALGEGGEDGEGGEGDAPPPGTTQLPPPTVPVIPPRPAGTTAPAS
jgi:hypothetical protein